MLNLTAAVEEPPQPLEQLAEKYLARLPEPADE
jgi:hypothetical protein